MIRKSLSVEGDRLEFFPRLGADFTPVIVKIPLIDNKQDEEALRVRTMKEVHNACGNVACNSSAILSSIKIENHKDARIISGATMVCSYEYCPLIDPPDSGDREPRPTGDTPPPLEAEVPLPTIR